MSKQKNGLISRSFAEQYIALSRATRSVCDGIGDRVELKDIPRLLHKLSGGRFRLMWSTSFCARDHIALERLDGTMSFGEMIGLLDASKDFNRSEFLYWHMETTSSVWGRWNYSLTSGSTYSIVGLAQRVDLNGRSCVPLSYDPSSLRKRWCAAVSGRRRSGFVGRTVRLDAPKFTRHSR
eukprot:4727890-Prymnesium_polylepis.2